MKLSARMPYMSCPRCGLTVTLRATYLTLERCPRCVARARIAVPMVLTSMGGLVITSRREAQALVLELRGELDLATAPGLEQRLRSAEALAVKRVVIDLRQLEFLDSAGLHVLINADRRRTNAVQKLFLRRGPRAVQRMFDLTPAVSALRFED